MQEKTTAITQRWQGGSEGTCLGAGSWLSRCDIKYEEMRIVST